ncbi:MAG TPA: CRTAC1 family protein [Candidatus Binatia bacterium]|nr:CRTAC1 family protein [Candidatus Binatia bacterium]
MSNDPLKPRGTEVQEPEEELAHVDDAVIGRAFRWSILAGVFLAIFAAGAIWFAKRKPAAGPAKVTSITAPVARKQAAAEMPTVKFTDITKEAGITFVHNNGAYGDKLLPETMGSGVAFLDYDNDGDQDLLFVNSTSWPGKPGKSTTPALYQNDGTGKFTDVTAGSGLDVPIFGMGVAVGDYDNDGRVDVFITAVGGNRLFHNQGNGKFRAIAANLGDGWSTAAAFVDIDNDGDLDLFVGNYVRWSREIDLEVGYKLVGVGRAYGQPMNFEGAFPSLYRNEGNGKFTDTSKEAGIQIKNSATGVPVAKTLGIAPIDLDGDGFIDLVVANDTVQNFVFHNERNGTFKEIGALSGIAFDTYGNTRGAMGIDAARYRDDGALGIAIGNFANEMTALYVSQNNPLIFTDEAIPEGIGPASRLLLKFGIFFFDYDLDGRLDVLSANGHLEEEISKIQASQQYAQPAQLFWNSGVQNGSTFVPVPQEKADADLFKRIVGRGSAYADIDGDGDLDVVLIQTGGAPLLLRNDQQLGHNWVRLKLVGKKANRDAIGAWVHVRAGGRTMSRQVMPTRSYLSASESPITIGLGKLQKVDEIEIVWPGGQKQKVANVPLKRLTVVDQE